MLLDRIRFLAHWRTKLTRVVKGLTCHWRAYVSPCTTLSEYCTLLGNAHIVRSKIGCYTRITNANIINTRLCINRIELVELGYRATQAHREAFPK